MSPRISCFIWRLLHKKTPTQNWTQSIGANLAPKCALCCVNEESEHLFFSCDFAKSLWRWLLSSVSITSPLPNSATYIWTAILIGRNASEAHWTALVFSHTIYFIWIDRNDTIFCDRSISTEWARRHLREHLSTSIRSPRVMFRGRLTM